MRRRAVLLLLPALVCLAGVLLLGDWIIDDAGISDAYARNIAAGHGFVSEPGRPPVEGYSDFLWVALLVPLQALRLFHPIVTPKLMGIALALWAFVIAQRALERRTGLWQPGLFATLWMASAPPIPIWNASGLENGLMMLLVVAMWTSALERGRHWQVRCGLLSALAAMTHPEGLLYAAFAVVAGAADGLAGDERRLARAARSCALSLAGFLVPFAAFLAFRWIVFHRLWPQTYYAKRAYLSFGAQLADLASHPGRVSERLIEIGRGAAGDAGPWLLLAIAAGVALLAVLRRLGREAALAVWLLAVGCAAYVLIEPDWMGEYRFATGAIVAFALAASALLYSGRRERASEHHPAASPHPRAAAKARSVQTPTGRGVRGRTTLAVALSVCSMWSATPRLLHFAQNPPTPYRDVERRVVERFAAYGRMLGIERPSILIEDVGAPLSSGRLSVYDVTGLVEPEAIATLKRGTVSWQHEHPEFYDWVFERIRPTFISSRLFWTAVTIYERDPRFVRDYTPIDAYRDRYVEKHHRMSLCSGDFVRRDALRRPGDLEALRAAYHAPPAPQPLAWRLSDWWRRLRHGERSAEALRGAAQAAEAEGTDPNRAAALYASALEREPANPEALIGLARTLDRAGRAYEGRGAWMRLRDLELAKGSGSVPLLMAEIAARLADPRLEVLPAQRGARIPLTTSRDD